MKSSHLVYSFVAVVCGLTACGGSNDPPAKPLEATDTFAACSALGSAVIASSVIGLPTTGASVDSATMVPVSTTNPNGEYCLVVGKISPVDPNAQKIIFNVALPSQWNGKAVQLGGGGWDGSLRTADSVFDSAPAPLSQGYATFGSDGGHEGVGPILTDASFGLNDEQLKNFGSDQLKKTRDTVMELIKSRYGVAASKTYFLGGSNGGREAMAVLQRWGQDYDGIVALFPAMDWTAHFMKMQAVGRAMRLNGGAGWVSQAKAASVRAALIQACDSLDGVADNVISNPAACHFNLDSMLCPGGGDTGNSCLSTPQLAALKLWQTPTTLPYTLANGISVAPNFEQAADASGGFLPPFGSTSAFNAPVGGGSPSILELGTNHWFADGLVRYLVMQDPNADTLSFDPMDPKAYLPRLQALSAILDQTNPDIQPFLNKGGKLIIMHGMADELVPTQPSIDYYQALVQKFGQASIDDAVRFYLIPGFAHGTGLSFQAFGGIQFLPALEEWVGNGVAPGNLVATDVNPGANNRTRPVCRYPNWPKYNGTGDVNLATSFTCTTG